MKNTQLFQTDRLQISKVELTDANKPDFLQQIPGILTPAVTHALPPHFQGIENSESAKNWLTNALSEGQVLSVMPIESNELMGFVFLYQEDKENLHLGYLLGESFQGKGFAKEMLNGLLQWCADYTETKSIVGGVETSNVASASLLLKLGFTKTLDGTGDTEFYRYDF